MLISRRRSCLRGTMPILRGVARVRRRRLPFQGRGVRRRLCQRGQPVDKRHDLRRAFHDASDALRCYRSPESPNSFPAGSHDHSAFADAQYSEFLPGIAFRTGRTLPQNRAATLGADSTRVARQIVPARRTVAVSRRITTINSQPANDINYRYDHQYRNTSANRSRAKAVSPIEDSHLEATVAQAQSPA